MSVDLVAITSRTLLATLIALLPSYSADRRRFYSDARLVLAHVGRELGEEEAREMGG